MNVPSSKKNSYSDSRHRALVLGGSIAGLLTAKVLSKYFQEVIIIERDPVTPEPEIRKGQPQAAHTHVLLGKGFDELKKMFPTFREELIASGVEIIDFANDANWHTHGGMMMKHDANREYVMASRPLLESIIRKLVLSTPSIQMRDQTKIKGPVFDSKENQVVGVELAGEPKCESEDMIPANLVIDCCGRASQASKWLSNLGFAEPRMNKVEIDVGYATRIYERTGNEPLDGKMVLVSPEGPDELRGGCLVPIENGKWICTFSGWGGDHATGDESEFMNYSQEMPSKALYDVIRTLKPVTEIKTYKYPKSRWLRFDKLSRFPKGFLVLGDAVCSFNPIYGQGMTATVLQTLSLDRALAEAGGKLPCWKKYFKTAARYISNAWTASALGDFQYRTSKGEKPLGTNISNWYVKQIIRASQNDTAVYSAFLRFTNLMTSSSSLLRPSIVSRVLFAAIKRKLGALLKRKKADTKRETELNGEII